MNHYQWKDPSISKTKKYMRKARKLLKEWKQQNNITERCVIHHRDDTELCREYNEKYYELWGHNLDGTFEYGKYVVFMTFSEHTKYHNHTREVSPETKRKIGAAHKGKIISEEQRNKLRLASKGRVVSEETRRKHSQNNGSRLAAQLYKEYKKRGGVLDWLGFRRRLKGHAHDADALELLNYDG